MNYCILFLLILIQLTSSLQLAAQEKWTLNDCINYALKNNLQLLNADMDKQLAEVSYRQSKWNRLPAIGAGSDAGKNYGRSVDPNTNGIINTSFFNNSYYLGTSVDLFRGFMYENQIRYNKFKKEATENKRINAADDLAFSVMNAFFNVIYFEELLKIANEQKALSELNVKKIDILVSTGLKSYADFLEVKANYEKEELFRIQTANNIATSWISLKKALNLPPERQIVLVLPETEDVFSGIGANIQELFEQHTFRSPYIRSFEGEWQASQKNVSINRARFSPSIRLQASYNTGYYETNKDANDKIIAFSDQINNNQRQFLGATLTIPLFNKNSVRFDVQSAKIGAEQAQTRLTIARQTLLYEMEGNYNELTASGKELQQSEKQMEADKLAFQAAQKKFDQGMINAIEMYTTKNRLANTTTQVLHAKLTYAVKKRILEFYKGSRFWE
ncbi:MAG: TolC family protein [Prolixibacteraceae bacterium]|jgi:outer membrane protein|nr:TolC family protein [Prolixibacteraceae bacterium]